MKWIIPIVLLMIVFSLGSALYYMMKDRGNSSRMVHSLMLRIGLSIALFLGILLAHYFGVIEATGIKVGTN
ncbi:twin transmembrane helix small protein [Polynucleobacter sp. MWH-UH23A]|uniref:twin transmembrane helix small protein n=1 Tax=Polynucleobacter sp. MWH-UH23A TaxID=1855613 RepID=UPI003364EE0E